MNNIKKLRDNFRFIVNHNHKIANKMFKDVIYKAERIQADNFKISWTEEDNEVKNTFISDEKMCLLLNHNVFTLL